MIIIFKIKKKLGPKRRSFVARSVKNFFLNSRGRLARLFKKKN